MTPFFLYRPFFIAALSGFLIFNNALLAGQKPAATGTCFLHVRVSFDPNVDTLLVNGFSKSLTQVLAQKFPTINLCMDTCKDSCGHLPMLKMRIQYNKFEDSVENHGEIVVTSKNIIRYYNRGGSQTTQIYDMQIITTLPVPAWADLSGLYLIAAEKIVENVRQEALCEVKISTQPTGSQFFIDSTVTGTAPKTILLPPGTYSFRASAPGYLPLSSNIDVQASGITIFETRLIKRRFYHSRYMIFADLFSLAAAVSFAGEWYYNDQYDRLGEEDFFLRPEKFKKTFNRAKILEKAGFAFLCLTGTTLCMTFFF